MSEDASPTHPPAREPRFLLYHFFRGLWRLWFRLAHRARFYHTERVPEKGACLIVANHQSFYDPPLVGCAIHWRAFTFLARASLFRSRFGGALRRVNALPIKDGEGDIRAIRDIIERLKKGEAVVIFPEGSRTFDGAMQPFREGAALIVRRAKCPVIPVAVEGVYDAWPRTQKLPTIGRRVAVMYAEPIQPEDLGKDINDTIERVIDDMRLTLREELRRASGGRYPAPGPGDQPFSPSISGGASSIGPSSLSGGSSPEGSASGASST